MWKKLEPGNAKKQPEVVLGQTQVESQNNADRGAMGNWNVE